MSSLSCVSSATPTPQNENTSNINISSVSELTDDEMDDKTLIRQLHIDDDVFECNGYKKIGKICDTLQGELFQAVMMDTMGASNEYVAIKRVRKDLWQQKIAYQNNIAFCVTENIIKEAFILNYLTVKHQPIGDYVIQFIDFFESEQAFYLVIEYIDSRMNLKQFVSQCNRYIQTGELCFKEYQKMIKYVMWQLFVTVQWMHISMRCCHLDLCMENIMLSSNPFCCDGNGTIHIDRNITIKLCDFGVAEVFPSHASYLCNKRGLNVDNEGYYAPKVFNEETYDARCADNWALGMILFECITIGNKMWSPVHVNTAYYALQSNQLKQYLHCNDMLSHFNHDSFCLLRDLLCMDQRKRLIGIPILAHAWFRAYFKQYLPQIAKKFKNGKSVKRPKGFPYYHHLSLS
eukprot:48824_1